MEYSKHTGLFLWRMQRGNSVTVAGSIAGTTRADGYVRIKIDGNFYRAHRLAWFYVTGIWPSDQIDHKDRNRSNNRWNNLRQATRSQNGANMTRVKSSLKGAFKDGNRWRSHIKVSGRCIYLGMFGSPESAHSAYVEAAKKYHGEFSRFE